MCIIISVKLVGIEISAVSTPVNMISLVSQIEQKDEFQSILDSPVSELACWIKQECIQKLISRLSAKNFPVVTSWLGNKTAHTAVSAPSSAVEFPSQPVMAVFTHPGQ